LRDAVETTKFSGDPKSVDDIASYIEQIARGLR
jgi:hypothetical protein